MNTATNEAVLVERPQVSDILVDAFHDRELIAINNYKFIVNSLTEQIPATSAQLLWEAARRVYRAGVFSEGCKIAGEEDKGAVLVAAVALLSGLPFGLARWYPSGLEGQVAVDFNCEYVNEGKLYLNGVERGDRVVIVDDVISTGGTMVALIKAIERAGAHIVDIICVAEKVEYGGSARVQRETGYEVKSILQISVAGERSRVLQAD